MTKGHGSVSGQELEAEIFEELFEQARFLEIIPPDLSPQFFRERFFYLFIERHFTSDYSGQFYNNFTFGEKYFQSMLRAFDFVFHNARAVPLSLPMINQIYLIVTKGAIEDDHRQYRAPGCETGFQFCEASKLYSSRAVENKEVELNLIKTSFGQYYYEKIEGLHKIANNLTMKCYIRPASEQKIKQDVEDLLQQYHARLQKIKDDESLDETSRNDKKIELIAIFINDFVRYHPYGDGNGRLSCFLLLNYLLIRENLTPALTFDPWYLSYSVAEELPLLVREGQLAYEKFFYRQEEMTHQHLKKALLPEIDRLYPGKEKRIDELMFNICGIVGCMWQLNAIQDSKDKFFKDRKAFLTTCLEVAFEKMDGVDYDVNFEDILSFELPIRTVKMIEDLALKGALALFDRDVVLAGKRKISNRFKDIFDIDLYQTNIVYKDKKIKEFGEVDIDKIRSQHSFEICAMAKDLLKKSGDKSCDEDVWARYCSDEIFRFEVLEFFDQEEKFRKLIRAEVLNSLMPLRRNDFIEADMEMFDYSNLREKYGKKAPALSALNKEGAFDEGDYMEVSQEVSTRFAKNPEISLVSDRYFGQVLDFYKRFPREITFADMAEFLKEKQLEFRGKVNPVGVSASEVEACPVVNSAVRGVSEITI